MGIHTVGSWGVQLVVQYSVISQIWNQLEDKRPTWIEIKVSHSLAAELVEYDLGVWQQWTS